MLQRQCGFSTCFRRFYVSGQSAAKRIAWQQNFLHFLASRVNLCSVFKVSFVKLRIFNGATVGLVFRSFLQAAEGRSYLVRTACT